MADAFASVFGAGRTGSGAGDDSPDAGLFHEVVGGREEWRLWKGGPLHRTGGPALIDNTGSTVTVEYRIHGELHRDDGPARRVTNRARLQEELWYRHGELHRDGGPALTVNWPQNPQSKVEYWLDGQLHRAGGPAQIITNQNGSQAISWFRHGQLHRDGGPALTRGSKDSGDWEELWLQDGRERRDIEPAHIEHRHGSLYQATWYQRGVKLLVAEPDLRTAAVETASVRDTTDRGIGALALLRRALRRAGRAAGRARRPAPVTRTR